MNTLWISSRYLSFLVLTWRLQIQVWVKENVEHGTNNWQTVTADTSLFRDTMPAIAWFSTIRKYTIRCWLWRSLSQTLYRRRVSVINVKFQVGNEHKLCFRVLNRNSARNKQYLKMMGFTHVLNTAEGTRLGQVDTGHSYYRDMQSVR